MAEPDKEPSPGAAESRSPRNIGAGVGVPALVVALTTLAVFALIVGFSFVSYDDDKNIFHNPYVNPPTLAGVRYLWTHGYYELYMPVTYTLWAICARFAPISSPIYVPGGGYSDLNPAVYHGVSLVLHAVNAVLVFTLLNRLIRRPWPAAAGALLFALHPMQVESVAWVTGMNNLTSGFFGLLALLFYVDYAQRVTARRAALLRFAVATLFYVLALLSKPTAVAVPLIAAVLEWGILQRPFTQWIKPLGPWAALAICLAFITRITSADTGKNIHLALWMRPFIAGDALAVYICKVLLPLKTSINSGRSMYIVEQNWWGYVTWLFPAALGVVLGRLRESARLLPVGAVLFVAALVPMLGFVPYYFLLDSTVADRYLYLAMLGPGLMLAWFASQDKIASRVRGGVCITLLLLFTIRTLIQLPYWHDTFTLASAQIAVNPRDDRSQTNFAIALAEKGKKAEALPHFRAAAILKPDDAVNWYHLGVTLADTGDLAGAVDPLRRAVQLDPSFGEAQVRLGITLSKLGRLPEALVPLRAASALQPNDPGGHYIVGVILGGMRDNAGAEAEFNRTLALAPAFPDGAYSLGLVQERQGKLAQAAASYAAALRLKPDDPKAQEALSRVQAKLPPR